MPSAYSKSLNHQEHACSSLPQNLEFIGLVKDCDIQAVTKEKPAGVAGNSGEGNIEIEDGWDDLIDDSG